MEKGKNRIVWIDQLRGAAFFLVVLGHVSNPEEFNTWIYSFHMALFFMISGLTINREKLIEMPFTKYILKLVRGYIVPYFWLNLMMFPLWFVEFKVIRKPPTLTTIGDSILGMLNGSDELNMPSNALWFLVALFFADIIFVALLKFTKGRGEAVLFLCVALCGVLGFLDTAVYHYWRFGTALTAVVFLYLGNCFMNLYKKGVFDKMKKNAKYVFVTIGTALAFGVIGWWVNVMNGRISMTANKYGKSIVWYYVAAIASSLAFTLLVMLLPKITFLGYIGRNTLFYIGVHIPVIRLFEILFPEFFSRFENSVLLAVCVYFGLIPLSWLCAKLIPYACGRPSDGTKPSQLVLRVLVTMLSLSIPVYGFLCNFGFSAKVVWQDALLFVLLALMSVVFVIVAGKACPIVFNDTRQKTLKNS